MRIFQRIYLKGSLGEMAWEKERGKRREERDESSFSINWLTLQMAAVGTAGPVRHSIPAAGLLNIIRRESERTHKECICIPRSFYLELGFKHK